MTECTGARYFQRQSKTRLTRLIAQRDRYKAWADRVAPHTTNGVEWFLWIAWRRARQDKYAAEIKAATIEKRHNQRRKANERKRDHTSLTRRGC